LSFAPARGKATQLQHSVLQLLGPGRLPHVLGPMAPVLEAAGTELLEPPAPTVEGVTRDAEVPAGQGSVPSVLLVPDHHPVPLLRFPGGLHDPNLAAVLRDVKPEIPHTRYNAGVRHVLNEITKMQNHLDALSGVGCTIAAPLRGWT